MLHTLNIHNNLLICILISSQSRMCVWYVCMYVCMYVRMFLTFDEIDVADKSGGYHL